MLALVLVLTVAADAGQSDTARDAGSTFTDPLYANCPEAPPSQHLDGGWVLLPPERHQRIACLMETCDVDRQRAHETLDGPPPKWWLTLGGAFTLGISAGFATKLFVDWVKTVATPPAPPPSP